MIAKKSYYMSTMEHKDTVLAEVYVDRYFIKVMQAKILEEIEEAAIYQRKDIDSPDDVDDSLNYIKDMIESYKNLQEALLDIDAKESLLQVPDEPEEVDHES